jgi:GNAT superfamily N-acetyltransferase
MAAAHAGEPVLIRDARPEDVPLLLQLLRELAEYERLADQVKATEELLYRALFSEQPAAEAMIAERGAEAVGYALFFPTFSTFLAIQGIWLEDIFVRPSHRKVGAGRALLAAVAARARERGAERLEWSALTWNELALGFYSGLGAVRMDDWVTHRLMGEELRSLAAESHAPADAGRR